MEIPQDILLKIDELFPKIEDNITTKNLIEGIWRTKIKTFGMQVVAGRFFAKDFQGDRNNYVVNETALKVMKMDPASAIGKELSFNGRKGEIIGVVA